MEPSPFNSQLKGFFIVTASLLVAIFLGYMIGTEDYSPLLFGTLIVGACAVWFLSGRFFWVLTIGASFLGGTFPILRGQFTPLQILLAMGLVKFLVEDVILRRVRLKMPSRFDLLMIAGFMAVMLYHGIHDRFGMRFLGSNVWGGRNYVNVFVGFIAFFVIQSLPMKPGLWAKFPYVVLGIAGFDLFVVLITTVLPGSIYIIFPFYSAVASSSLQEAVGGEIDVTGRIGAFGNFGLILIALVLAGVSLRKILHPANFWRLLAVCAGGLGVLLSGFRSSILNTALLFLVAGIRDLKAGVLLLLPAFAAAFFILSVVNSEVVALPKAVQRGLSFLPGDWDADMARDANASNEYRFNVWSLWAREFFPKQPILGRGFGFKSEWTKKSTYYGRVFDYRQIVETGNIHNGLFATVDALGLLGTLFFVIWNVTLLFRCIGIPLERRRGDHFALRFTALYLSVLILSYWVGASTIGSFLPQEFALAGVFLRLHKDLKEVKEPRQPGRASQPPVGRDLVRA